MLNRLYIYNHNLVEFKTFLLIMIYTAPTLVVMLATKTPNCSGRQNFLAITNTQSIKHLLEQKTKYQTYVRTHI